MMPLARVGFLSLPLLKGNRSTPLEHLRTPDVRKRACPVWGALDGNLLSECSKAPPFDSMRQSPRAGVWGREKAMTRAEHSGAGANRCAPLGGRRGEGRRRI